MKKIIVLILVFVMLMSFVACGNHGKQPGSAPSSNQESKPHSSQPGETNTSVTSGDITLEMVMNHEETPADDFWYVGDGNGGYVLSGYYGADEIVVIPESWNGGKITKIASYVFGVHSKVKAVRLSSSVKILDFGVFAQNKNLEIVVLGSGVVEVGESAFQECTNLRTLILNDGLVKLNMFSIGCCDSLKYLSIPESVTDFAVAVFYGHPKDFVIGGKAGSAIEAYAQSNDIPFKAE